MSETQAVIVSQAEREAAAYNSYLSAVQRDDRAEAVRLWYEFTRIHGERAAAVVEHMEQERGLS